MRNTLTLSVDDELADFIDSQQEMADPSVLIMKLFHKDMEKHGFPINSHAAQRASEDEVIKELELSVDREIPAAG